MATAEVELAKLHFAANELDQAEQFARAAVLKVNGYVKRLICCWPGSPHAR